MVEKKKPGRPKIEISLPELEKLAGLHCTYEEVAGWFGVTKQTIINRMNSDDEFKQAWERGLSKGRIGLRRIQWRIAEQGNSNMAIFLGRVWLNQRDKPEEERPGEMNVRFVAEIPPEEPLGDWLKNYGQATPGQDDEDET